jgi:hypothetical protein
MRCAAAGTQRPPVRPPGGRRGRWIPRLSPLPALPGRRAGRRQRSRPRLRVRPAHHHGRAGRRRHRGGARAAGWDIRAPPAAAVPPAPRRHPRPAGQVPAGALRPPAARRHRPHRRGHRLRLGVRQPAPVQPEHARGIRRITDRPAGPPAPRGPARGRRRPGAATPGPARLPLGRHVRVPRRAPGAGRGNGRQQHVPADDHPGGRAWPAGSVARRPGLPAAPRALALLGRPDPRGGTRQPVARHRAR